MYSVCATSVQIVVCMLMQMFAHWMCKVTRNHLILVPNRCVVQYTLMRVY